MNAQRLKQIEETFLAVTEVGPAERERFLKEICGADEHLQREVESLLAFENNSDSFLGVSAEALAAEMFADRVNERTLIDRQFGPYKVKALLGKGGMGEVYLADDVRLNRQAALKFLSFSTSENANQLRRFRQEAFAASALNHPNILTIYEFEARGDVCYLASEYIEGQTIRELLKNGKLTVNEALSIAEQTTLALSAAHGSNIVHRDIKPENIMRRKDGFVKVLDFGLAKLTGEQDLVDDLETLTREAALTKTGTIIGTTSYMSPEQIRGRADIDARTDIWSVGVVLFEMLTGNILFNGETVGDTIAAILKTDPAPLSNFIDDCPPELQQIIDKAVAKNAEDRYRQIGDLAADLKSLRNRLIFEAELERSNPANKEKMNPTASESPAARHQRQQIVVPSAPADAGSTPGSETIRRTGGGNRSILPAAAAGLIVLGALIGGFFVWRSTRPDIAERQEITSVSPTVSPAVTPALRLSYSLTVQGYYDGRYKEPFKLSGEMLFRNRDRIRLHVKSPQPGYLYILNESPPDANGKSTFNILFPSPTTNNGTSLLPAEQEIQIPEQSWFQLDEKQGTESIWLVWSLAAFPELESAKRFANAVDRGKIKDAGLTDLIAALLQKHQSGKGDIERDDDKKISQISANADILAHVIKLKHH